ncbi:MAG: methanogenesis marker 9 domain-containing protein [Methanobacteriaceae archaeon]|mgnify:FL=1|jgi:putative methanogenesis marker domain 9|uniref:methanogenesis marker 9 domain-containing protein n=1 Tax=unclassified Methanobrevibacter TaxID=2638681 RepID=UPI00375ACCE9|nr:methanogenesis marker 9 domain-containing protein [Methanobacteriaceae archaeon]MDD4593503.1 methanogenesis marker 9 domain-containing protein [Methanobacteriaceae archaeon]
MGWDDAPSHICRGGDVRGLAFCCPPVKPCPVMNALREVGITPQEYIKIKEDFAKNTRLGEGAGTCFGSLVWCCKTSKPCPLRDMVLRNINMSPDEYLTLKKELSEALVGNTEDDCEENINALVDAFEISETEANKVLTDCNNDLRMAIKLLRVKALENGK